MTSVTLNPYATHLGTREPRDVIETTALELHHLKQLEALVGQP